MADSSSTQEQNSCGEIGTCATCRKACALLRSGNTHQHGPRNKPCPGSGKPPAAGSRRPAPPRSTPRDASPANSLDTSTQVLITPHASDYSAPIDHPKRGAPLLKRIPRGARQEAGNMLQRLLVDVVRQEDDTVSWTRLLGFTSACLVVPGRGGKSRNFTTLVNRQIRSYDGPVGVTMGADQGRATKFRSVATDNDSEAAKRASAKLEEGDVRGAIRILASKDTVRPSTTPLLQACELCTPPHQQISVLHPLHLSRLCRPHLWMLGPPSCLFPMAQREGQMAYDPSI